MKQKHASRSKTKQRILVVEDEPIVREFLAALLKRAGYVVEEAEHALAAICSIVRAVPDLILADIRMPIVDGLGLMRELRSHRDSRHIPVVAVTGLDTPKAREAARQAGCIGYITKPVDAKTFPDQIAEFLRPPRPVKSALLKSS